MADRPAPHHVGTRAVVPLAMALTAALSWWGLTDRPLWLDEALSLGATAELFDTLRQTAGTMGLYYVLLDGWTSVMGTSVRALRLLSLTLALATIPVVAALARRCLRPAEVTLGILACAAMPGFVRYAQEARSYALVTLLAAISWMCLLRAVHHVEGDAGHQARAWWMALSLVTTAGVLSHGLYGLQFVVQAASLLLLPHRRRLLVSMGTVAIPVVLALVLLTRQGAAAIAEWVPPLSAGQLVEVAREVVAPSTIALVPLLLLAGLGGQTLLARRPSDPVQRWTTLIPVLWGLGPPALLIGLSVLRPYGIGRYVIASVPAIGLLVAVGALRLGAVLAPRLRPFPATAVPVLGVVGALALGQVAVHDDPGEDWRGAARLVASGIVADDVLVLTTVRAPFEAAWNELAERPPTDRVVVVPTPRPLGTVRRLDPGEPWTAVDADLAGRRRLWVVHRTMTGNGDASLDAFRSLPSVREGYEVERHVRFEGRLHVIVMRPVD